MPSRTLTIFYPDDQTTVIMIDHDHRFLTAFDRPTGAEVAHVLVTDSRRNPLSFLTFSCHACDLAAEAGRPRTNITISPNFGPPPAYEVDRTLPDYHEQDQERTPTDRPRSRRTSRQQPPVVVRLPVTQPRRPTSGSPVRRRFTGREALEGAIRRPEERAEIIGRDFQPLVPEAPPAALVIARDFEPDTLMVQPERGPEPAAPPTARDFQRDDLEVQPESEAPAGNLPRSSPARTSRVQEEELEIISRDFQPPTPEAPPAAQVIARDFQPDDATVQPEGELITRSLPPNAPVRTPRFSEVFDERHYEALARFIEEARENSGRQG